MNVELDIDQVGGVEDPTAPVPREHSSWIGPVLLAMALGILGQAWAGYQGRTSGSPSQLLYWVSLVVIFGPAAALAMSRGITDTAKVWITTCMSLAMLVGRFVLYPDQFQYHDELIHVSVLNAIDQTSHLFSDNSLLPATPYYPGLEIATSGIHQISGLSEHAAGVVVLMLARLVMTLALIRVVQHVSGNASVGALAGLVYATNPQYVFFNSQFSYQSMALPLCCFAVYLIGVRSRQLRVTSIPCILAVVLAVAATHHLTSAALIILLWAWVGAARITGRSVPGLLPVAGLSLLVVCLWTWIARTELVPYLTEIAQNNMGHIVDLFHGKTDHEFFADSAGDHTPVWERLLSLASVALIMLTLLPALYDQLRVRRVLTGAAVVLCAIAALYPIIPAGHLTNATAEVADRASGFIFIGLGYVLARWWLLPSVHGRYGKLRRLSVPRRTTTLVAGLIVLFIGGTVVGSGPAWLRVPGDYLVSADNRSVDPLALEAAAWEASNLPRASRVATDRVNGLLATAIGNQHVLTSLGDGIDQGSVSQLLLRGPTPDDRSIVRTHGVAFLIADQRLASGLPHVGVYIDTGEYLAATRTQPPSVLALTKFDDVLGAERIFDNGAIRIYDLRSIQ